MLFFDSRAFIQVVKYCKLFEVCLSIDQANTNFTCYYLAFFLAPYCCTLESLFNIELFYVMVAFDSHNFIANYKVMAIKLQPKEATHFLNINQRFLKFTFNLLIGNKQFSNRLNFNKLKVDTFCMCAVYSQSWSCLPNCSKQFKGWDNSNKLQTLIKFL